MRAGKLFNKATMALMFASCKIASPATSSTFSSLRSANVRPTPQNPNCTFVTTTSDVHDPSQLEAIFQKKHSLRSKIRKELKNMSPIQRAHEDSAIQNIVLDAPWFKSSQSLCTYVSSAALREVDTSKIISEVLSDASSETGKQKRVYVPRVEDRFSNMKMLRISSLNDLVVSSMDILEPSPVDSDGKGCEDVMQACEPLDLFILPGLAFDRSGRRLGRSGGYYDMFLRNYEDLLKERSWKRPLLVALAYSIQIVDEGAIAVTPNDISVDALVSPAGFTPISPQALKLYG